MKNDETSTDARRGAAHVKDIPFEPKPSAPTPKHVSADCINLTESPFSSASRGREPAGTPPSSRAKERGQTTPPPLTYAKHEYFPGRIRSLTATHSPQSASKTSPVKRRRPKALANNACDKPTVHAPPSADIFNPQSDTNTLPDNTATITTAPISRFVNHSNDASLTQPSCLHQNSAAHPASDGSKGDARHNRGTLVPGPPVKPDPSSAAESSKKIIMPSELVKEVDSAVRVTQANLSTKLVPAEEIRDEILPRTDLSKDKTMGQAPLVSPDGEETESDDFLEKAAVQLSRQENERKKAAALKRRNGKRRNTRSEYRERILSGPTKNPRAKVSIGPTQCSSLPSTSTQEYESPTTSVERGIEGRRRSTRTSSASNRQKTRKTGVSTGEKGPSRSLDTGDNLVNDGRSGKGQGETQATEYATINVGDMIEDTACLICNDRNDAEKMVLCDGCSSGCHIFCMRPSRGSIPLGVWMCPACHATAKKHEVHLSRMVFLREKRKCFECEKRKVEDEAVQGPVKGCAECKLVFHTACLRRYHMVTMTSVQDVTWKCRWCLEYEKKRKVEAGVEFQSPKKKRQRLRKSAEAGLDVAGKLDVECGMVTPPLSCGGSPGLKRSALVQGSVGSEKPKAGTNANGISEGEGQRMSGRKRRRSRTRKVADSSSEDSSDNEAGSLGICDFTDAKEGGVDLGSGPKESCSSKGSESQGNAGVQRSKDVIADIGVNTMDENRMDEGGVMKRSNPGIGNVEGDGIDDGDETQSDGFGF